MKKNVLLTGASRGLGLEICSQLLETGYNVYAASRIKSPALAELEKKFAGSLFFKDADLSKPEVAAARIFCADFLSNKIPLWGLVNNAAYAYDDLVVNLNVAKLRAMFEINSFAPMFLARRAIRNMIFNKTGGSIVNVSSVCAHTGYKGLAMYAASKGALEAFSKNVAREWGSKKIRSNCVAAGFMPTDMSASLDGAQRERIFKRTALKEPASVASVAATAVFLLSDKAESVTGQTFFADAGTI